MTGEAVIARLIKRHSYSFLCVMGTRKTDSNKLFQIQGKTQISAKLILSVVHMFLKMGGTIHPPTQAQRQA